MTLRQPTAAAGTVVFRTDAALQIGAGHVMRCLTLADALQAVGWQCHFICRPHPGHLGALIEQRGHTLHWLPRMKTPAINPATTGPAHAHWLGTDAATDAAQTAAILQPLLPDWLVVDHYALDATWQRQLRPLTRRILVIDDLADRPHDADLLLDQNLGSTEAAYKPLVPPQCRLLVGTRYALLRPEFARWRETSLNNRRHRSELSHVLVTLGGVDINNVTSDILAGMTRKHSLPPDCSITVVMGPTAPWREHVKQLAAKLPWKTTVHFGATNMAELMAQSTLAIGAAGSTSWERCCLGLPTLMLVLADNQRAAAAQLQASGAAVSISIDMHLEELLFQHVQELISSPEKLQSMSDLAAEITDGEGITRVLTDMAKIL